MEKFKNEYKSPEIQLIQLDTQVSLYLESVPPFGPGETVNSDVKILDVFRDVIGM